MTQPDTLIDSLDSFEPRSRDATATCAQAFARLLALAEQRNSGQIVCVVQFIAATYNGQPFAFDLFDLRARHRDQRRHAALSRRAALGACRSAHARA